MNSKWEVGETGFVERDYVGIENQIPQENDFQSILIKALNESLKSTKPQWRLQTPIMYWTHADCGILLELAKVTPGIVDHLPRYQVASSDPAATEGFYSALRQVASVAQGNIRRKRLGYQHVQVDSFSSSWGQLPWQFSGLASRFAIPQQQSDRNFYSQQHQHQQMFNWSLAYHQFHQQRRNHETSYFSSRPTQPSSFFSHQDKPSFSEVAGSRSSGHDEFEVPFSSSEPFNKGNNNRMPNCAGFAFRSEDYLSSLKSSDLNHATSSSSSYGSNRPGQSTQEGYENAASSESSWTRAHHQLASSSTLNPISDCRLYEDIDRNVTSTVSERCGQGRYWPSVHNNNPEEYGSVGSAVDVEKSGADTFGIGYFRSSNSFGASKHSYHCREEEGVVKSKETRSKPKYHCVFCKGNEEDEATYSSHPMKINNIVICPSLRNYICTICQATGDNAHTIKYCPQNKRGFFATRSHEKCNSRNRSRTKMKVLPIEALDSDIEEDAQQEYQKPRRPIRSKFGTHAGDEYGASDVDDFGESDEYEC